MASGISTSPLGSAQKLDDSSHQEEYPREDRALYDLREVIIRVVANLPLTELRDLKLSVGEVFDAIKRQR